MPTLVVGMLAVSLRSLGKHGTRHLKRYGGWPVLLANLSRHENEWI